MEIIAFLLAALNAQDAPPIRTVLPATPPAQQFLQWIAQDARCGGMTVSARSLHQPRPMLVGGAMPTLVPVTVRFRIDGDGRPLSIRRDEGGNAYLGTDIVPSLAASTFAIDAPQNGCTMRYLPVRTPLDVVDRQTLFAYAMIPGTPPLPRETWQRLQPPTADCADRPGPRVRSRAYPDFFSFPGSRGNRDWAMMQYDLNARGRPINVTVSDHSGNAALNAASIRAVRDSRFTPGARTGCVYRYWREAETVEPPPSPEVATMRADDANCPAKLPWTTGPSLVFPSAFLNRRVEGWAIVAFDVAPWGDVGNLRVLASEPAAEFGTQAVALLRNGKKASGGQGYTGCVEKVRFAVSRNDMASAENHRVAAD